MYPYNLPDDDQAIREKSQEEALLAPAMPPFESTGQGRPPRPAEEPEGEPAGPPPERVPERRPALMKVEPGSMLGCLRRYTYIWLRNGQEFWMFPTNVSRHTVTGYRWTRFGWAYTGVDLDGVEMFTCV